MKKMTILLIFLFFCVRAQAPEHNTLLILKPNEINLYERLIKAVTWVESKNGLYVWNPKEEAVGWFQIRQCRVDDYNKRTKSSYKLKDFYDYELSKRAFLYFTKGRSLEQVARSWNGSGPKTIEYWSKVQFALKRVTP